MIEILRLSWRDFLTRKFILLSITPFLCSVVLLGVGLVWAGGEISAMLKAALSSGDFGIFDVSGYEWLMAMMSSDVVGWIVSALFYTVASYLMLMLSVIVALFIAGFFTPIIVREINARHYRFELTELVSTTHTLGLMAKVGLKFLAILCVCLPFIFVPGFQFIAINVPFFYLYHKFLLIDVGSNVLNTDKFKLTWLQNGGVRYTLLVLVFYLISLIPLLGLCLALYFIIVLTHLFLGRQRVVRI